MSARWVIVVVVLGVAAVWVAARPAGRDRPAAEGAGEAPRAPGSPGARAPLARRADGLLGAAGTGEGPRPLPAPGTATQGDTESRDLVVVERVASQLQWSATELAAVRGDIQQLHARRRQLFADLATRTITVEQVQAQLGVLRSDFDRSTRERLGEARAARLHEALRESAGHIAVPVSPH